MYCIVCRLIFCFVRFVKWVPFAFCFLFFFSFSFPLSGKEGRKERRKGVLDVWRAQLYICMYGTYVCRYLGTYVRGFFFFFFFLEGCIGDHSLVEREEFFFFWRQCRLGMAKTFVG